MSREVFVDSGAFVAFLFSRDRHHDSAVELFSSPPVLWSTSVLVVAETYSWFLHRSGEDAARNFRVLVSLLPGLQVLDPDESHRQAVWKKLDEFRGLKLTFVDASSLVWIEQRSISTVWSTDGDLAIGGAIVHPGPPATS